MDTSSETFNSNIAEEHREMINKCNLCDFASDKAGNLRSHLMTHSRDKSYNQCDYASVKASNMRTRLKTHSGDKQYKCNQCDFAFVQASDLRRHLKTHF